jgi:putative phage-type endonuclease
VTQQLSNAGIGASEISSIAGVNPYASPWDVWLRKTGQAPDIDTTPQIEWGHRLEPVIRQAYADKTNAEIYVPPSSLFHAEMKWARATPDGIVVDRDKWQAIVQIKNVGTWVEKAWREAPPAYVQIQEQWELYVTGLERADIAVLIGGSDFRIYTVHRDDKMIGDLVTIAADFWRLVETKTPPKVDDSDACQRHFERKYAKTDAIELVADDDMELAIAEWRRLHIQQKSTEKRIKTIRNVMRKCLAEAKADRISSSLGTVFLSKPVEPDAPIRATDWRLVAELLGSTKCANDEFQALVEANTKTEEPATKDRTLYAPKQWAKEAV